MSQREHLGQLIQENLESSPNTEKLRWILDANGWDTSTDVVLFATDEQVEAFLLVWGLDAYAC